MSAELQRLRIAIQGAVQGVGFRPFVFRLAEQLGLYGWVLNSSQGVQIEVDGTHDQLSSFRQRIEQDKPPLSNIYSLECSWLDAAGFTSFEIRHSSAAEAKTVTVLPDIATCGDCLREMSDPHDRRYRYPFINCTNCGPRFSIIRALPYDRPNTTMASFPLCPECQAEYADPRDRRFHAQPVACPRCGPQLALWDAAGHMLAEREEALQQTVQALRSGGIVAVKGLGGFHLMADARDSPALRRLRERKQREEKPLALMFPDLHTLTGACEVGELERNLLSGPAAPIMLLRAKCSTAAAMELSNEIAPGNPFLGVMLPYTPLHHLLLRDLGFPVVATSGNISDETICIDEHEALQRLSGIADLFLVHNRPIARHADDSIVRLVGGREMLLRRARGFAPLPIQLPSEQPQTVAYGAHLKTAIAVTVGRQAFVSQHIGDLETAQALAAYDGVIRDMSLLYDMQPQLAACDMHPDYLSTQQARASGLPRIEVQHHYAHILSCMADNDLKPPVLGLAWDGTGYGPDQTVWGGEFLVIDADGYRRFARLRTFGLPGGESAVREPRRSALGLLYEFRGPLLFTEPFIAPLGAFTPDELAVLERALARQLNCPRTSSIGRLFDAVAAITGLRQLNRFEGQAAMALEFALKDNLCDDSYPIRLLPSAKPAAGAAAVSAPMLVDWQPLIEAICAEVKAGAALAAISARFHNALAESAVLVAAAAGLERVALSGGCFQNKYLCERVIQRLREAGFRPYWHQRMPPNDGGIALGQAVAAGKSQQGGK